MPDIFGLEASELASLGAKRFHGKPPLIGLGVHRHSGGGRLQAFAIIRFLFGRALILQLSLRTGFALMPLPVTVLGHGLMDAPPQRPAKEMIEHYAGSTLQAAHELADLAHAEGDQSSRLRSPLLCDVTALSFTRKAARKPKASMASVMCRYQPCQERIS